MRKSPLSYKVEVGLNSLVFVIFLLITLLSLAYLANSNRNATKGYALKTLQLERSNLITKNEIWDMKVAQVQALDHLQSDPKIKKMIAASQPLFVRGDTAIANR
ncbi:hypothetical protein IPJ72_04835 [Candidatus Peregrinibacteria bacterium]|nr:MAG: hypothetical protein IPJ72_04835 [Candidatus Peregrinibacteria bacterium]